MFKNGFRWHIRSLSIVITMLLLLNIFSFNVKPVLAEDLGQVPLSEQNDGSTEAGTAGPSDPTKDSVSEAAYEEEIENYTVSGALYGIAEDDMVEIMLSKSTGETVVSQNLEEGQSSFSLSDVPAGEYTLCVLIDGATALKKDIQVTGDMTVEDIHVVSVTGTILNLSAGVAASVYLKQENEDDMTIMPLEVISTGNETEFTYKVAPGLYGITVMAEGYEDYTAPAAIEVGNEDIDLDPIEMVLKLQIVTDALLAGKEGGTYSAELQANGGKEPLTWAIAGGALPGGLTLEVQTGIISGRPGDSGDYSFEVTVTDLLGHADSQTFNLNIARRSSGGSSGGSTDSGTNATFTDREVKDAINLSQEAVTLVAPEGKEYIIITGTQYKELTETGKDIVISIQGAKILLNLATIELPAEAEVIFNVKVLSEARTGELVGQTDLKLIGKIYEISIEIKNADITGNNPLKQSVRVSLPVNSSLLSNETYNRLDVFYFNESENKWEPMGALYQVDY